MTLQPETNGRGGSPQWGWMLAGAVITLAFVGVAVLAYMLGAGVIGPRKPAPTGAPSTVPPSATPSPVLGSGLYIEYILDASGSMNESLPDGTLKLAVAKDLLSEHLQAFRPETSIGLRAYGHRVDYREEAKSCLDIELVAPVETGQLPAIVTWLRDFQAMGMTPLAESIRQAMDDFVFEPVRINSIVMLSDGIETCEGDPCGLVQDLKADGINFTIHVIGLDVDAPTREQLSCIAHESGGTYHDARSEQELREALARIHAQMSEGQTIAAAGVDTPTTQAGATSAAALVATSTLAPTLGPTSTSGLPAPTEQATEPPVPPTPTEPATNTPVPMTPTEAPTDTPVPPTPKPTPEPRVLPQPIFYKIEGLHHCKGVTTEFGEEYRASYDKVVTEVNTCQEGNAKGEDRVEVVCRQEFSDPEWVSGDLSTAVWNVKTGKLVASEGEDLIPDGVGTETTTVSLAGQEFEVVVKETSYRDEWVDEGNKWWEEATCTYHEHANGMTVRWTCRSDVYVRWEGRTVHVFTCDSDTHLTETNLDL